MLLVFDIGNTSTVAGIFEGEELMAEFRLKTDQRRTLDEYYVLLNAFLDGCFERRPVCEAAVISSVVPPITDLFVRLAGERLGVEVLVIGPGVKTGISIKTLNPGAVGADRVVNAVAVKCFYGLPALVIDFGTATSFDFVDADSNYLGGIIASGIEISMEALVANTAKLPRIELTWPERALGRDTVTAMQSGAVLGYHYLVEGLIERLSQEIGPFNKVVATGELGALMAAHSKRIQVFDPHLTLKGMQRLWCLNQG